MRTRAEGVWAAFLDPTQQRCVDGCEEQGMAVWRGCVLSRGALAAVAEQPGGCGRAALSPTA